MNDPRSPGNQGWALLLCMLFTALALVAVSATWARLSVYSRQMDLVSIEEKCFWGVESAMTQCQTAIEAGEAGAVGLGTWKPSTESGGFALPAFDAPGLAPVRLLSEPEVEYIAVARSWERDGKDNNGDGTVDGPEETGFWTVQAAARMRSMVRVAEVVWKNSAAGPLPRLQTVVWREIPAEAKRVQ